MYLAGRTPYPEQRSIRVQKEAMKHSLKALVLGSLVWSMLPHAVLAVQPDVSTDAKRKAQGTPVDSNCVQVPDSYQTIGPLTVQELEAESLRDWDKQKEQLDGSVPRVPFGKANAQWQEFLRQLKKGDKLFMYDEGCCKGIIIVRKECIVDWFQTSVRDQPSQ
jgi:hypothetical protein